MELLVWNRNREQEKASFWTWILVLYIVWSLRNRLFAFSSGVALLLRASGEQTLHLCPTATPPPHNHCMSITWPLEVFWERIQLCNGGGSRSVLTVAAGLCRGQEGTSGHSEPSCAQDKMSTFRYLVLVCVGHATQRVKCWLWDVQQILCNFKLLDHSPPPNREHMFNNDFKLPLLLSTPGIFKGLSKSDGRAYIAKQHLITLWFLKYIAYGSQAQMSVSMIPFPFLEEQLLFFHLSCVPFLCLKFKITLACEPGVFTYPSWASCLIPDTNAQCKPM